MRVLPLLLTALLVSPPSWGSPGLLPPGSATVYGGTGLSVWTWGMSNNRRDPAGIVRLDTWGGVGLAPHLMVSGGVPLVHGRILVDQPGVAPCPNRDPSYCAPVTTLGDAHVLLHAGARVKGLDLRAAVGPRSDAWTAGTRARYVNVGQGTWGGLAELSAGGEGDRLGGFVEGRYVLRFGRPVAGLDMRAPGDAIQGQIAAVFKPGRLRLQASALGHRQLRGVDYGREYLRNYYRTDERWGVVAFAQLRAEAKVSVALSERTGLHVAASRAVYTENGPRDHTDVSVGVHVWMPGD